MHRQEAENDHFPAGGRRASTQGTIEREGGTRLVPLRDGLLSAARWGPFPSRSPPSVTSLL